MDGSTEKGHLLKVLGKPGQLKIMQLYLYIAKCHRLFLMGDVIPNSLSWVQPTELSLSIL